MTTKHDNEEQRKLVIELIQTSLIGKIDPSINFNPQFLADAILEKLDFNLPLEERNSKIVNNTIKVFEGMLDEINKDMDNEMEQLGKDEVLLKNFIKGQKTACEKLRENLKSFSESI